ncbi:nucleoid-associated protein [Pseudoxanthomonas sp. PXM04]|uniref:nucleoid-associated protein n=1 Tax=Pseudoxanthomonas sp. PXM04 TaxID=2769297 RepID=UPI00177E1E92|nr:nucleoid-associated protein [Pseudoxanthomonas sp. PXM04]MBD9377626.1 nucleoid-associated protein [Pseudoxanthomonas sp. PXM04]
MEIVSAIAHKVEKFRGVLGATSIKSDAELEQTDELDSLMLTLLDSYNNRSSRYSGSFETDTANYPLSNQLKELISGDLNFKDFSLLALNRLCDQIKDVVFASGGYLLVIRYSHNDRDMLLIAKLNPQSGAIFSEDLHKVIKAPYLNLDKLQVAARVDIKAWSAGAERYLTFVLRREQDSGPSDYFQKFVGCRVDQDSKIESKKLVIVVKDFASNLAAMSALKEEDIPDVRRRAFDFIENVRKGEAAKMDSFEGLANAIWPEDPNAFLIFLNGHADPPSAGFAPDATTIKGLSDINFKSKELTLKMTYEFRSSHVRINEGRVIIENAPERLVRELTEG